MALKGLGQKLVPPVGAWALRLLGATYRFREVDAASKTPFNNPAENFIYAFWHSQLLPACQHYRHPRIRVLVSRNLDGELMARAMVRLGYPDPVRGSTSRGASSAIKSLAAGVAAGEWAALFPDGPRGPARQAQTGALSVAKLTGRPVIPVGFAATPCLRLGSWDRMMIPLPFARGLFVFGEPLHVPADCGREKMETLRLKLQEDLDALTLRAEKSL